MWQRFTEKARKVVFYAQEEAGRCMTNFVSTEHILLGLLREDNIATTILRRHTLDPAKIREATKVHLLTGTATAESLSDMQLSSRSKKVIDFAFDEARLLDNDYIGTEHLLLGLVREEEGLAGRVLAGFDIDLIEIRKDLVELQAGADSGKLVDIAFQFRNTSRAADWVDDARAEAAMVGADAVKAEHEFLAELHRKQSVLSRALSKFGVDLESARAAIQEIYEEDAQPDSE